jgi:hypothetical protein
MYNFLINIFSGILINIFYKKENMKLCFGDRVTILNDF